MNDKTSDPFVELLNKWKVRVEQLAFFLFLVLHLLLIQLVGLSLLLQHIHKVTSDWMTPPEVEKPKEGVVR